MNSQISLFDTLGAIQMNNGVVKMYFVAQGPVLSEDVDPSKVKPELQEAIAMPLPGFLYALSVIGNFMKDERMRQALEASQKAGVIPEGLDISSLPGASLPETGDSAAEATKISASKKNNGRAEESQAATA
ncbi:MAG: hypothetical protein AAF434_20230 [Pseudomonadota bacterium]